MVRIGCRPGRAQGVLSSNLELWILDEVRNLWNRYYIPRYTSTDIYVGMVNLAQCLMPTGCVSMHSATFSYTGLFMNSIGLGADAVSKRWSPVPPPNAKHNSVNCPTFCVMTRGANHRSSEAVWAVMLIGQLLRG